MMDKLDALLGMEGKIVILKPYLLKWQSCVSRVHLFYVWNQVNSVAMRKEVSVRTCYKININWNNI